MGKSVCTPFFTLEIEHGGIFLGAVRELEYCNSSVEVLDYLDPATFSYEVLEQHLNWLGYPKNHHIIYWCLPDKTIFDGLVRIKDDEDLQQVIRASVNHKVLLIMVHHSDFMSNFRGDFILKETSFQSPVREANYSVGASNSGNIICLNVEKPTSEVAEDSTEPDNLLSDAANLFTDVVHTHVLTDGAEPNLLNDGAADLNLQNDVVADSNLQNYEGVEVVDEHYDDPSFLQNIYPNQADPLLDPIESPTSMVYNMAQRELARRPPNRVHGPLPEQSSFVASAGAAIPQPRVTTEMSTARLTRATTTFDIGAGSGRARGAGAGQLIQ
ncbi:Synaptic vesicle 2-related protein [Hordeum vulgare]|nr:Synaptic vesicle 2-related protein [Hordeum vulgare]